MGATIATGAGGGLTGRRAAALALLTAGLALASWAASWLGAYGAMAAVWPTNALALVALLRGPAGRSWSAGVAVSVFVAIAAAALVNGRPAHLALISGGVNLAEVALAAWLLRRAGLVGAADVTEPAALLRFLARAALIAPAAAAGLAAPVISARSGLSLVEGFWQFFSADALGIVLIAPFGLAWAEGGLARFRRRSDLAAAAGLAAAIVAGCVWLGLDAGPPDVAMLVPLAVLATLRFGAPGAAAAAFWTAAVSLLLSLNGWGGQGGGLSGDTVRELQEQLAILPLSTLPVAAILARLDQARREAEAANRAKSVFLANMSHEIRTPLNGVIGVADVLAQSRLEPRERELVDTIRGSGATLQRLLADILDLARVESGKLEIEREPFRLGETVRTAAALARPAAEAKGLALEVEIDPACEGVVEGDAVRVRQVLTNLLSNAVKFTPAGVVRLQARPVEAGVRLSVTDTGAGLTAEQLARVFERFQQADGSITRRFGGAGLGLAISRQLAELMGGRLGADSTPGRGATFWLELPVRPQAVASVAAAAGPAPAPAAATRAAEPADGRRLRVLSADDHPTNRRLVELVLEAVGAEVVSVDDGDQALEAFAAGGFDLVLMDMQMPRLDGLSAVRAIRALEAERGLPRTPVLMLSANALPEHLAAGKAAGADGHLAKPVSAADLHAAVAAVAEEPAAA